MEEKKDQNFIKQPFSLDSAQVKLDSAQVNIFPENGQKIDPALFILFSREIDTQCNLLTENLLEIEKNLHQEVFFEAAMRATHSIKGAARIVKLQSIVEVAHAMEDSLAKLKNEQGDRERNTIEVLLQGVDFLIHLSKVEPTNIENWLLQEKATIHTLLAKMNPSFYFPEDQKNQPLLNPILSETPSKTSTDRFLRVTAENLNRLMGLAGESLIESQWLSTFGKSLQNLKKEYKFLSALLVHLQDNMTAKTFEERAIQTAKESKIKLKQMYEDFSACLIELDDFIRQHNTLSERLYREVISNRMRPFEDGIKGFPRMVRDLSHELHKKIRFEIQGKETLIDREILEKLETPLGHLLRNAIDHGIETIEERTKSGKIPEATILLEAHQQGGMLIITVTDDGKGFDLQSIKKKITEKNLLNVNEIEFLSIQEIVNFLFLPGFSTANELTEISGRGVGLNIVKNMVEEVGGNIHVNSIQGKGAHFSLRLPLTLSVIRALLVKISGEIYAFPLTQIDQVTCIEISQIRENENRYYFFQDGKNIQLLFAWRVLQVEEPILSSSLTSVICVGNYGIVVDEFVRKQELVVHPLDNRLGKIPHILAGSILENGSPILIIDVQEMTESSHPLMDQRSKDCNFQKKSKKKILIVDDSFMVREVEYRLLHQEGYEVNTANNGEEAWEALCNGHYDLVVTDVEMPDMNGIELVRLIKNDPLFSHLPVIIVSHKEDTNDLVNGLEVGADYYLTKSAFHDTSLLEIVHRLIGTV